MAANLLPVPVASLPPATVGAITGHLAAAGEYATMGLFVDHLGDEALHRAVEALDGEALLRTVAMARTPERIDHVIGEVDDLRLTESLLAARREQAWLEALTLVAALSDEQLTRMADLAIGAEEPVVDDLVSFAFEEDLLDTVLGLVGSVSEPNLAAMAAIAPLGRPTSSRRSCRRPMTGTAAPISSPSSSTYPTRPGSSWRPSRPTWIRGPSTGSSRSPTPTASITTWSCCSAC